MERQARIATAFDRLFRTYPQPDRGGAEDLLRERMERAAAYFAAVAPYELIDIEAGIANLLTGSAAGHNPAFVPSAPLVAAEIRRVMHLRLDAERRVRRPALPPPDIPKSAASRARVRRLAAELLGRLAARSEDEAAAAEARRRVQWQRANAAFLPAMDEAAVAARLGFAVGDADGERGVA